MQNYSTIGLGVALFSGIMIGTQAIFFDMIGRAVGPFRASMVLNITGGIVGGLVLLGLVMVQGRSQLEVPRITIMHGFICAAMGILILTGVTFAFERVGIAGAVATVFLGQMLIGMVIDTLGLSGGEKIPLDLWRVFGLVVVGAGVAILTWRQLGRGS